jgi:hypothetical protein
LYNLALLHYSLHNYSDARNYCEELYRLEPDNSQVIYLLIISTFLIFIFYHTIQAESLHKAICLRQRENIKKNEQIVVGASIGIGLVAFGLGLALHLTKKH